MRGAPAATLALMLAGVLLAAGCGEEKAGRAPEAPKLEVALQDDAVFVYKNYYDRARALDQARELGVSRIKAGAPWARIVGEQAGEKRPPRTLRYDWAKLDELVDAAAAKGIRVQLALIGPAPAWASGDGQVSPNEPDAALYGEFAAEAAGHFKGRVDRYSIWNEPNHKGWLAPQAKAPELYRALYEKGFAALTAADPQAKVMFAETAPYEQPGRTIAPLEFVRRVLCRDDRYRPVRDCPPLRADGFAHHPYDFANAPKRPYPGRDNVTIGSLGRLVTALDRLAKARALTDRTGKPLDIYLTEFGYFATGPLEFDPRKRAAYLVQGFELASRSPRVREMLQYLLVAPPPDSPGGRFDTSLISQEGVPDPAFGALREWSRKARQAGRVKALTKP